MTVVGTIESVWRYPVKSMRGEALDEAFVGFAGLYGDRIFAFRSSGCPEGLPYLTAREQGEMLKYRPRFRHAAKAALPVNLVEAAGIEPGLTPAYADLDELVVDVETPAGTTLAIDDPALAEMLVDGIADAHELTLVRSDRGMTDCRPVSMLSVQTAGALGDELGAPVDKRRFRANICVDLGNAAGFAEDEFVGRTLRVGATVLLSVLERDPRCKMITLDPDTGASNPKVLRSVAQGHDGKAGVYAAVLSEGVVRTGDDVELLP